MRLESMSTAQHRSMAVQAMAWSTVCTRHACMQAPHVRQDDHPASYACMSRDPGASGGELVPLFRYREAESLVVD